MNAETTRQPKGGIGQFEQPSIQREPLDDLYGMATFRINGMLYAADALTKAEAAAWEIAGEFLDLIETEALFMPSDPLMALS